MDFILTNHFGWELPSNNARQAAMKSPRPQRLPLSSPSSHCQRRIGTISSSISSSSSRGEHSHSRQQQERRQQHQRPRSQRPPLFEVSSIVVDSRRTSERTTQQQQPEREPPMWLKEHRKKGAAAAAAFSEDCCSSGSDELTLETVNLYEDEEQEETSVSGSSSNSSSSRGSVSFADPLVTDVWYRPIIRTVQEKEQLFYTDADYKTFRADFFQQRRLRLQQQQQQQQQHAAAEQQPKTINIQTRTRRRVKFQRALVTATHVYPSSTQLAVPKDALFYSEHELQKFLDDFVSSLNGGAPEAPTEPQCQSS